MLRFVEARQAIHSISNLEGATFNVLSYQQNCVDCAFLLTRDYFDFLVEVTTSHLALFATTNFALLILSSRFSYLHFYWQHMSSYTHLVPTSEAISEVASICVFFSSFFCSLSALNLLFNYRIRVMFHQISNLYPMQLLNSRLEERINALRSWGQLCSFLVPNSQSYLVPFE